MLRSINRRKFILASAGTLATFTLVGNVDNLYANPVLKTDPAGEKDFPPNFLKRYYKWHCQKYFDFEKHFSETEREFVDYSINQMQSFTRLVGPSSQFTNFLISHHVFNSKINSSRLAVGTFQKSSKGHKLIQKILAERNLDYKKYTHPEYALGVSWDMENQIFKIYQDHPSLSNSLSDQELEILEDNNIKDFQKGGMFSYVFKESIFLGKRTHLILKGDALKNFSGYPFPPLLVNKIHAELIIDYDKKIHFRVESPVPLFDTLNKLERKTIIENMAEFQINPDSFKLSLENGNKIYYI